MIKNNFSITVALPVKNCAPYLPTAIESILNQSHGDFNIIIVDNLSNDNTFDIAKEYSNIDSRIIALQNQTDLGMGGSLNRILKESSSDYIAIMNGDDIMLPDRLEKQILFLNKYPNATVIGGRVIYINSSGTEIGIGGSIITVDDINNSRCTGDIIAFSHPTALFNRLNILKIGGYRSEYWPVDDADLWSRVIQSGGLILTQSCPLIKYRISNHSISFSSPLKNRAMYRYLKYNVKRSLHNEPEITYSDFTNLSQSLPLLTRVDLFRKDLGYIFYKKSISEFASNNKISFIFFIVVAFIFRPFFFISNISSKIIPSLQYFLNRIYELIQRKISK